MVATVRKSVYSVDFLLVYILFVRRTILVLILEASKYKDAPHAASMTSSALNSKCKMILLHPRDFHC
jgi:hypothetical protein